MKTWIINLFKKIIKEFLYQINVGKTYYYRDRFNKVHKIKWGDDRESDELLQRIGNIEYPKSYMERAVADMEYRKTLTNKK